MAMHLAGVPRYTVMLIGRWRSDAFMAYLREQVLQFTQEVSLRMIQLEHFFHAPPIPTPAATPLSRTSWASTPSSSFGWRIAQLHAAKEPTRATGTTTRK